LPLLQIWKEFFLSVKYRQDMEGCKIDNVFIKSGRQVVKFGNLRRRRIMNRGGVRYWIADG
jgi:hypothetical protein